MIAYLFLGIALLGILVLMLRWFSAAEPKDVMAALRWGGLIVGGVLLVLLIVGGRLSWIIYLVPLLLPWLARLRALSRRARNYQRMADGGDQSSTIETRFLRMTLDHADGSLAGEVVGGPQAGRGLNDLDLPDLLDLWRHYRAADTQSSQLLEAYLDRRFDDWRDAAGSAAGAGGGGGGQSGAPPGAEAMTAEEAYRILGLHAGADEEAIRAAHHRLISQLHPDRGGSDYLAAKVNQARDVLLGG